MFRRAPKGMLGLAVGCAGVLVHVLLYGNSISAWTYLALVCGAAVAAVLGAVRAGSGRLGALVAAGVSLSALGDIAWQVIVWVTGEEPYVSVADLGWLTSYVAIGAALLVVVRQGTRHLDVDGLIDVGAITAVALLIQWNLTMDDIVGDGSLSVGARTVLILYPALDAVLLGLVVRAAVSGRLRGPAPMFIASGALCWMFSDFGYTLPSADTLGVALDAGWTLGAVLLAMACWQPAARVADVDRVERVAYGSVAIILVPLLVPGVLELVGAYQDDHPDPLPMFLVTLALVAIAFVRTARALRAESGARASVRSQERFARAIARNSSDAVAVLDASGRISGDAPQLAALVGHEGAATDGVDPAELLAAADVEVWRVIFRRCLRHPGQTFDVELRVAHADGDDQWLGVRLVNLVDDPDAGGVVVNLHDISDRKRAEAELAHQAFHDGLTGLANRALFTDRVEQALRRNSRDGAETAVIFLDLDAFKTVNDSLGHGVGDDLLREVANRLAASVRAGDTVARLGGDEFAVLLEQATGVIEEAERVADRILAALRRPVRLRDQTLVAMASVGIAVSDRSATAASLLRDADVAMYKAKAAGKGRSVVYTADMRLAAVERLELESDLADALERGELRLVYQPVVALADEKVTGFEALLRWEHPRLGNVPPDKFVPLAEETGVIVPLGRWILNEACQTAAHWQSDYPGDEPLTMSVNVSGRQLADPGLSTTSPLPSRCRASTHTPWCSR